MQSLITTLLSLLDYVWNTLMNKELLPGITIKVLFLFTWVSLVLAEFFRVMIFSGISDMFDDD